MTKTDASPVGVTNIPLTGERTVPGIAEENYWFRRHEVAYLHLLPYCRDAAVLEAGCGEGYGADMIASVAREVVGLDYDAQTVAHMATRYPSFTAVRGNLAALPLASSAVDVVVNLQVIEHLWDQPGFLAECARVIRPGGLLLVSTPNRITFSPGSNTPLNPFHTREMAADELARLLVDAGFTVPQMLGLHHGRALRSLDAAHNGSIIDAQVSVAISGQAWPERLSADVASVSAEDFDIHPERIDDSLDLIAIARMP